MSTGPPAAQDIDELLTSLDEADAALRALYRQLAEDPDLAVAHDARLKELHARRLDLAQRVGLAALARRRTAAADVAGAASTPELAAESSLTAPSAVVTGEPARAPGSPSAPDVLAEPQAEPASDAEVAHWKSAVRTNGLGAGFKAAPSVQTAWPLVLHELMDAVRPPRALDTTVNVIEEVEALDDIATDERQQQWARLPKSAQQLWLSTLVARTRALKALPSATPEVKARVKTIIGRYPAWAKEHMPGHVNGMRVMHEPLRGSWTQDARDSWDALADLLGDEPLSHRAPASTRKPRREKHDDGGDGAGVDEAWPLLGLVRGRRAVMLGGDPREPNRERLERALQIASLEWPPIDGPRKVQAVVERIRRRAYDLVLVLQPFVAHKESDAIVEAAKSTTTPWALAEGYGVTAVKLALERFLGGHGSGVSLQDDGDAADSPRKGRAT